jgi:hypothetical protein
MPFLEKFLAGDIPAADFHHADHVRAGYELLRAADFLDAVSAYGRALKIMTARVGKPEKLHHTITIAFLAVIAERIEQAPHTDFDAFLAANPDLMDRAILSRWYKPEHLKTDAARSRFVLPDLA